MILGWFSVNNNFYVVPLIFYSGAIFWTLGYDTIYGFQDIKDDEIIGVKSTSIKFKKNPINFLIMCYTIFILVFISLGFLMNFSYYYFLFFIIPAYDLFFFQIKKLDINQPNNCFNIFKHNNFFGFLIVINLLVGKIIL